MLKKNEYNYQTVAEPSPLLIEETCSDRREEVLSVLRKLLADLPEPRFLVVRCTREKKNFVRMYVDRLEGIFIDFESYWI